MTQSNISVNHIVACDINGCIGNNGEIPWHLPADLKRFKELTSGGVVVMGRKTFESLNCKPLPNRTNIVITNDLNFKVDHASSKAIFYSSISAAIEKAKYAAMVLGLKEVWIIGGQTIYEQTMPYVDRIEATILFRHFKGDAFYPRGLLLKGINMTGSSVDTSVGLRYKYITYKVNKEMTDNQEECSGSIEDHKDDSNKSKAIELLEASVATLIRCGKKYDSTGNNSERIMDRVTEAYTALTGEPMTPEQANIFMICLKLVRAQTSSYHDDDHYIDGVNYFAMAGEAASEASTK